MFTLIAAFMADQNVNRNAGYPSWNPIITGIIDMLIFLWVLA